jgi:isoleucyl-tRNA synthetase
MSKSLGNYIEPEEIISENGAEILRLWVAMHNYKEDARFGKETFQRLVEAYRKIRNTWRFMLGNVYDFSPDEEVKAENLLPLDRWVLEKANRVWNKILKAYDDYEYHVVYHSVYNFFTIELSSYYLDVLKDRLYCSGRNSRIRKSAQTALFTILKDSLVLMAPILPFTTDEAWEILFPDQGKEDSVHLEKFPEFKEKWLKPELFKDWEDLILVRERVLKELEVARENKLIGNSLEAQAVLKVPASHTELLKKYEKELASLFIVSCVKLEVYDGEELSVEILKAPG